MKMNNSFIEGTQSEKEFINLRGSSFIRKATKDEDINEHWDVLDKEFGRVDVKAAKRKYRNGPIDYTIWWELRTVKRPPHWESNLGWGVPNGIDRLIAVRSHKGFYLVSPDDIVNDMRTIILSKKYGRDNFCLHERKDRGDLMTILPLDYIQRNSRHYVEVL